MGLSNRLKNRVDIYGKMDFINSFGEIDFRYSKIKSLWAEVSPQSGKELSGKGNTIYSEISHKFTVRSNAIPNLTNDMYFMFKNQRYDIGYFNPNYKYSDSIDIFCVLVVE